MLERVTNFVRLNPVASTGIALMTASIVHSGIIGWEASVAAGADVELRREEQRAGHVIIGESPEHIARRSEVFKQHEGETYADCAVLATGAVLFVIDALSPSRRRRLPPTSPLAVV